MTLTHRSGTDRSLSDSVALDLVQAAAAAPSMHNVQPWRFRVRTVSEEIRLCVDPVRTLPVADPQGRALLVGCGAALFNLRLAVTHLGREPVVRLMPHPTNPVLVASVRLAGPRRASQSERDLYQAIWRRHTNRGPFSDAAIPSRVVGELTEAARVEGAELRFLSEYDTTRVLGLVAEADRLDATDPQRRAETAAWVRPDPDQDSAEGIPAGAFGPRVAGRTLPLRDFGASTAQSTRPAAEFETRPRLAVLFTRSDTRADWLRAGQALERVLLTATVHGLAASFLNQALEHAELRWLLLPSDAGMGNVHMLLRLGYGDPVEATPRRPVDQVLEITRD
jgi:nitroreductase